MTTTDAMTVTDAMFAAVAELFGVPLTASVELQGDEYVVGYREGRDVCVIARGKTWDETLKLATQRVTLVDQLLSTTSTDNAAIATAAIVPVRFVRIRRRDVVESKRRPRRS